MKEIYLLIIQDVYEVKEFASFKEAHDYANEQWGKYEFYTIYRAQLCEQRRITVSFF